MRSRSYVLKISVIALAAAVFICGGALGAWAVDINTWEALNRAMIDSGDPNYFETEFNLDLNTDNPGASIPIRAGVTIKGQINNATKTAFTLQGDVTFEDVVLTMIGTASAPLIDADGGKVTFNGNSTLTGPIVKTGASGAEFNGVKIEGNNNASGNAVVEVNGGTVEFKGVTLSNNTTPGVKVSGGTATFDDTSKVQSTNAAGTAIEIASGGDAKFTRTAIEENDGTAIDVKDGGKVSFSNVKFDNNKGTKRTVVIGDIEGVVAFGDCASFNGNTNTVIYSKTPIEFGDAAAATTVTGSKGKGPVINVDYAGIDANKKSKFTNVTFDNKDMTAGPLVRVRGNAEFSGGTKFTNNNNVRALELSGNNNAIFDCQGVEFSGNAGAVTVNGGTLKIDNYTTFAGNKTTVENGGAINILGAGKVDFSGITAENSFNDNEAVKGGAIYNENQDLRIDITEYLKFLRNKASEQGGAIYTVGSLTVTGATFKGNQAAGHGGAIYSDDGSRSAALKIEGDCTFEDNHTTDAGADGGAIYTKSKLTVSSGDFKENTAMRNGGAIYVCRNDDASATVNGGSFLDNKAGKDGGAIFVGYEDTSGTSSTFYGGRVAVKGGKFGAYVQNNFSNEAQGGSGGAIWCGRIDIIANTDPLIFINNRAARFGGAVYCDNDLGRDDFDTTIEKAIFKFNRADSGGAIGVKHNADIKNAVFFSNTADQHAGAADVGEASSFQEVSFVKNNAVGEGGAIKFEPTYASGANRSANRVENCYFLENKAGKGGAIFAGADNTMTSVFSSYFQDNVAQGRDGNGGAISIKGDVFAIYRSTFKDNATTRSDTKGGAIYCEASFYKVVNVTFYKNEVGESPSRSAAGGALYLNRDAGTNASDGSAIVYCTFFQNGKNAAQGGALYSAAYSLNMLGNILIGNGTSGSTIGCDTFRAADGRIASRGYNIIADHGAGSQGVSWMSDTYVDDTYTKENDHYGTVNQSMSQGKVIKLDASLVFAGGAAASPDVNLEPGVHGLQAGWKDIAANYLTDESKGGIARFAVSGDITTIKIRSEDKDPRRNPAFGSIPTNSSRSSAEAMYNDYARGGFPRGVSISTPNHTDARNYMRPERGADAGAYQSWSSRNPEQNRITSVTISGIRNATLTQGQIVTLVANAYNSEGELVPLWDGDIEWKSTNPAVAHIDTFRGTLTTRSPGETIITATPPRYKEAASSVSVVVGYEISWTNVALELWNNFAKTLSGSQVTLMSRNESSVLDRSIGMIKSAFRVADAKVISPSDINEGHGFALSSPAYAGAGRQLLEAVRVSLNTNEDPNSVASIFGMKYSYTLTSSEIADVIGVSARDTANGVSAMAAGDVANQFFKNASLVFTNENGESFVVIGSGGRSFADACSQAGVTWSDLGGKYVLKLDAFIADANGSANVSEIIGSRLVLADKNANGRIDGTLRLVSTSSVGGSGSGSGSGSGGSGEGGGGGCAAGAFALALIAIPFALRMKKR